ncbi:conserved hypothetical protein [Xanthomonas oryzae pv. oryzae KACC 10331]|uniref:Uncharacterized protein n=1 Tax=Xanthomonas oryzae pv. oryzae (strain KACC10331 / KXO85) TaxID=291331 RepID=Q5GYX4_XANOR|nr:conserved hypothetical protein [Xanthomonas oryzae pv. oryzae KACC 10331]
MTHNPTLQHGGVGSVGVLFGLGAVNQTMALTARRARPVLGTAWTTRPLRL